MKVCIGLCMIGGLLLAAPSANAQRPGGPDDLVNRMMAFDADKNGSLTRAEVTDSRLIRLFDRADADKNGIVTKDELTALATKEQGDDRRGPGGPGGFGGPGGPRGGPMMGRPRPGEVLPMMARRQLELTADQTAQLDALQKEVDAKLAKILTSEQRAQLKEMRDRGPGGPPGGRGGPGGPPPRPPGDRD